MTKLIICSFLFLLFCVSVQGAGKCSGSANKMRGCYVPTWSLQRLKLDKNYKKGLCTHIFVAFALINNNKLSTGDVDPALQQIMKLKKKDPNLKVKVLFKRDKIMLII